MTAAYRINGQLASAADFYGCACNPQRSVVVEACAGAGKTWMLVSRILRALLEGTEPQQILAVTFTRKAAGEMRGRLQEWLQTYSTDNSTHAQRVQALMDRGMKARQAEERASDLGQLNAWLLAGGREVEVRTFHGWFVQLMAHAPLQVLQRLGLPAQYELLEEVAPLAPTLMRRFHGCVNDDASLRADYVALVGRHRRTGVQDWLHAAWHRGAELTRADAAGTAASAVAAASELWPDCAAVAHPSELLTRWPLRQTLEQLAQELSVHKNKTARDAARNLSEALLCLGAPEMDAKVRKALYTGKGTLRQNIGDSDLLRQTDAELQLLAEKVVQHEAHEDHRVMLRLARVLLTEYAALKRSRGLVDMGDLERCAEALLGDAEVSGWVQERLDQQVRQVLIDEFQDTSPLQWQALAAWLSAYAGAGGGASGQRPLGVFIVGDPKQSIYRFRGAEPRVFLAAQEFVVQGLQGDLLGCDHTRRNAAEVIEAVNKVFETVQAEADWGPFRNHTTEAAHTGQVLHLRGALRADVPDAAETAVADKLQWRDSLTQPLHEPQFRLRSVEAEQAARAVADLVHRQGFAPGDVMLLARTRANLVQAADALARHALPHVVAEALKLQDCPEAQDLVAVLDVLVSPAHDLALARALRSPVFSASDDDLLQLSTLAARQSSWLDALLAAAADEFKPALQRAQKLLLRWQAAAATLTPHELLDRVMNEADVLARVITTVPASRRLQARLVLDALLGAALDHGGGRFATTYGFVRDFHAGHLRAHAAAPVDAVQLLTVHGAKGLEARAVILLDSDPMPRRDSAPQLLVDWPASEAAPLCVAFVRSASAVPRSLQALWGVNQAAQAREELNGLYVAMTRARERLVFSRTEPYHANTSASWWQRGQPLAQLWEPPDPVLTTGTNLRLSVPVLPRLTMQAAVATTVDLRPATLRATGDAQLARLGQAVHRVLEWVGRPGSGLQAADWPAACAAAAREYGLQTHTPQDVLTTVRAVLDSAAASRYFTGPQLRWAGVEVPVAARGQVLRIDRLVALAVEDNAWEWWVLDYKLHHQPQELEAYREQMRAYVVAVQALQSGQRVRGAFITGRGAVVEVE